MRSFTMARGFQAIGAQRPGVDGRDKPGHDVLERKGPGSCHARACRGHPRGGAAGPGGDDRDTPGHDVL